MSFNHFSLYSNTVEVNGSRYHIRNSESGKESVLLLHGWPDDGTLWNKQAAALVEAGYHVICPDLLGFGLSDAPLELERYSSSSIVADLIALLDSLNLDKVHFVAHDYGAVIGWELVTLYPERIKSYVAMSVGHLAAILDISFEVLREEWIYFLNIHDIAPKIYRANNGLFFREVIRSHPYREQIVEKALKPDVLENMQRLEKGNPLPEILLAALEGQLPELPKVTVPSLGIWSDKDDFMWESQMKKSNEYLADEWHYEKIEGAGHWFMLEQPEKTNSLLLDWFVKHA